MSSDSVSLFQIGFKMENNSKIAVDKQLPLILDICAHKNQERALRNQLENRKSLERKPSRKRRKKNSNVNDPEKLHKKSYTRITFVLQRF